jgi:hypothetical protein
MSKKDWAGIVVYTIAVVLVFTALTLLPEHGPSGAASLFQR